MTNIKQKIVLVEDDLSLSRMYQQGLETAGFEVFVAFNGQEAVDAIGREMPDLVLLDVQMPIKNGYEALADIRGDEKIRHIPVILFTNLDQLADIRKGIGLGAVDYLIKSDFSIKEMVEKVKERLAPGDASHPH